MNIHEYQAKELLRHYGVPVPEGFVAWTPDEAAAAAAKLPGPVFVVKAQIHAGGRGAGRFADDPDGKGGVRVTRSAVLEVLREDFVRTARAKGLGKREVLWSHVLRNAMIPVMTVMGLQFANLLAGTIVIENVFYLPGLGRLIFQSIANRDLIVVRNCVMLLATMVVIVNFVVDVLYAYIDPRIKVHDL